MPPKPSSDPHPETPGNDVLALVVNGDAQTVPCPCTVATLLVQLGLESRRVAVAIDRDVIPRSSFATHRLAAGDRIEILEAVGGG